MDTQKTIDADDILNAIYSNVKNDEFSFQCEGCGDDSRDGSVLARKQIEELLFRARQEAATAAFSEGRKQGLKEMDEAWKFTCFNSPDEDSKRNPVEVLRQEYSAK